MVHVISQHIMGAHECDEALLSVSKEQASRPPGIACCASLPLIWPWQVEKGYKAMILSGPKECTDEMRRQWTILTRYSPEDVLEALQGPPADFLAFLHTP